MAYVALFGAAAVVICFLLIRWFFYTDDVVYIEVPENDDEILVEVVQGDRLDGSVRAAVPPRAGNNEESNSDQEENKIVAITKVKTQDAPTPIQNIYQTITNPVTERILQIEGITEALFLSEIDRLDKKMFGLYDSAIEYASDQGDKAGASAFSELTGTALVSQGGTGLTSYAVGDVLYASGATTLSALSVGSNGQVLTLSGGVPVWATNPAGGAANIGTGDLGYIPYYAANATSSITATSSIFLASTGDFGIGTTSPTSKLSVEGTTLLSGGLTLSGGATTTADNGFNISNGCFAINGTCVSGGGSGSGTVNAGTQGQLAYYSANGTAVSGTSTIFIDTNGNVGIGSSTPSQLFSVAGNLALTGELFDTNNTGGTNGQILQTSGSGVQWVATSSLGIAGEDLSDNVLDDLSQTSLADPGADQIVFWDDSDTQFEFISSLSGLTLAGNTLSVDLGTSIDESELNISGAPTDDFILVASSSAAGGFEWVATSTTRLGLGGAGTVSSVTNADGSLTVSPTTGAVVVSLNVGNGNTWTASQIFSATSSFATSTFDLASTTNLRLNGITFSDLLGSGLQNSGGTLTLDATGDWTGTLDGIDGTNFLRSDVADSAAGLITFTAGLLSQASSTISDLTFTTATGTNLVLGGDTISDFSGTGLTVSGNALTADLGTSIDESELNISGAPTDGFVLQASSTSGGGLVWTATSSLGLGSGSGTVNAGTQGQLAYYSANGTAVSGTSTIFIDTNGNVGIGSSTPTANLTVQGSAGQSAALFALASSTTSRLFTVHNNGQINASSTATSTFANGIDIDTGCFAVNGTCISDGSGSGTVNSGTQGQLAYYGANGTAVSGTSTIFIDTNGNVGIGTTTLTEKLTVTGGSIVANAPTDPTEVGDLDDGAFAEDVYVVDNYAYVADDADGLEIIDVSSSTNPVEIGSVDDGGDASAVFVSGKYAYVADEGDGLEIIDISDPTTPVEVGSVDDGGAAEGVYVSGKYAYVADYTDGLEIIDVSDPTTPVEVGSVDDGGFAEDVYVSAGYAYVADGSNGLEIIDISDPTTPVEVGSVSGAYAMGVYVSGRYAYVADTTDGLYIVDISSSTNPVQVANYNTGSPSFSEVFVAGRYAYLGESGGQLIILDISSPTAPVEIGSTLTNGQPYGIYVSGRYAYVADGDAGLNIIEINGSEFSSLLAGTLEATTIDITENLVVGNNVNIMGSTNIGSDVLIGGQLAITGSATTTADNGLNITSGCFAVNGSCVKSGGFTSSGGFTTLDTSSDFVGIGTSTPTEKLTVDDGTILVTPGDPVSIGTGDLISAGVDIQVVGDYAYTVSSVGAGDEFKVFDISDRLSPTNIGGADIGASADGLAVSGNYAYVGDNGSTITTYDVSDPSNPISVSSISTASAIDDMHISGSYLYVVTTSTGDELEIFNIADPTAPRKVSGTDLGTGDIVDLAIAGSYAYIVSDTAGDEFEILDISDPSNPIKVGGASHVSAGLAVTVAGNFAYIGMAAGAGDEFEVYDISDPSNPTKESGLNYATAVWSIALSGDYAYLGGGSTGGDDDIVVLDVSSTTNPTTVGGIDIAGTVFKMKFNGSNLFVVNNDDPEEFEIFDINGVKAPTGEIGTLLADTVDVRGVLHVEGIANFDTSLNVGNNALIGGALTITGSASSSLLSSHTNPALIVESGYVGIGTGTPSAQLDIQGQSGQSGALLELSSSTGSALFTVHNNGQINASSTATSTFANGIDIDGGCFAINGTCISGGGGSGAFTSSGGLTTLDVVTDLVGIGSSTPTAKLTVQGSAGQTDPLFALASSTNDILYSVTTDALSGFTVAYNTAATTTIYDGAVNAWSLATSTTALPIFAIDTSSGGQYATSTFNSSLVINNGAFEYDSGANEVSIENLRLGPVNFDTNAGRVSWIDLVIDSSPSVGTPQSYTAQINSNEALTVYGEADGSGGVQNTRVLIGTTSDAVLASTTIPDYSLIVGNGVLCVDDGDDSCDDSSRTVGGVYAETGSLAGLDIAENYPTKDADLTAGDLVMFDPDNPVFVTKYQQNAATTATSTEDAYVGVVATAPGVLLGGFGTNQYSDETQVAVTLAGRVPVTVNFEGGSIYPGDRVSFSSVDGVGAKATTSSLTIGVALDSYVMTGTSTASDEGSVTLFVDTKQYIHPDQFAFGADGRLGIGTSSPTAQLHTTGAVRFSNFGAGTLTTDANGNVLVSSDERLKQVEEVFAVGLEGILGLTPIKYRWATSTGFDTESIYTGFSAQNVEEFIPEAIGEDPRGFLTLSDRPLLAAVINAIRELWHMIKGQDERILELEERIEELENQQIQVNNTSSSGGGQDGTGGGDQDSTDGGGSDDGNDDSGSDDTGTLTPPTGEGGETESENTEEDDSSEGEGGESAEQENKSSDESEQSAPEEVIEEEEEQVVESQSEETVSGEPDEAV